MIDSGIIFTNNTVFAAKAILQRYVDSTDKKIVIVSSYERIEMFWRRAILSLSVSPSFVYIYGNSKRKKRLIKSNYQIFLVAPNNIGKLLSNRRKNIDILILDDLTSIAKNKSTHYYIKTNAAFADYVIGVDYRNIRKNYIRYIPAELKLIGKEELLGLTEEEFFEKFYFVDYINSEKGIHKILTPKPEAAKHIKGLLKKISLPLKYKIMGNGQLAVNDDLNEPLYIDYAEKSQGRYIKMLIE